jgi:uncharacterized membrane protein
VRQALRIVQNVENTRLQSKFPPQVFSYLARVGMPLILKIKNQVPMQNRTLQQPKRVLLTIVIIFVTGLVATNIFGQQLIEWWEKLLTRVPVVKSIYSSVKQVSDTLFSSSGNAFRKAF